MRIYIVNADSNGAYVDSGYVSETVNLNNVNWIAVFHDKLKAQAYVTNLNALYSPEALRRFIN